jgi:hypothetical protein
MRKLITFEKLSAKLELWGRSENKEEKESLDIKN